MERLRKITKCPYESPHVGSDFKPGTPKLLPPRPRHSDDDTVEQEVRVCRSQGNR